MATTHVSFHPYRGIMFALLGMMPASGMPAEPPLPTEKSWSVRAEFQTGSERANPIVDRDAQARWHLLRTSGFSGPVETRQWLRDGKYVALSEQGANLFDAPLDGWAYRSGELRQAPLIASVTADYDVELKFKQGELLIAPGPEHAAVIAWESPVTGALNIAGVFEHAQNCCGGNSQINWYVELGPAPDAIHGFQPVLLAHGSSDFGSPNQVGEFHIVDQAIRPGEFVYFIVDAVADGTSTPHHGDATRFDVTFTIGDAIWPAPPSFEADVLPVLAEKCLDCHGADVRESQLDLRSLSTILQGGESGSAIVIGDPTSSLLV
ncbi:MAG: c-type cytochrome domain-containing protein, partial [Planctomycetota bacterium]